MWFWVILVELGLLVVIGLLIRNVVSRYTSRGLTWWSLSLAGFVLAGFSGAKSTVPSSAPRVTITGLAEGCVRHVIGRGNYIYLFQVKPLQGLPVSVATRIKSPPCWSDDSLGSDGRVYRIVYLDDANRKLKNEAISIEVIKGQDAGWRSGVDARPFGLWLGIPAGVALIIWGGVGAVRNRRAVSDQPSAISKRHPVLKDGDSELTDLKL